MPIHHIIPKCMGGTDDPSNLVELTYEEHVEAHRILMEQNPGHQGLAFAYHCMSSHTSDRVFTITSNAGKIGGPIGGRKTAELGIGVHTFEVRSRAGKIGQKVAMSRRTPEENRANSLKAAANQTQEQLNAKSQKAMKTMGEVGLKERARKGVETRRRNKLLKEFQNGTNNTKGSNLAC